MRAAAKVRYVALLRAVNVGGTSVITMEETRRLFAALGFEDVATHGASGNVLFTAAARGSDVPRRAIEEALAARLGKPATVILRTGAEMRAVVDGAPFEGAGEDVRLSIAFLDAPTGKAMPARLPDGPGGAASAATASGVSGVAFPSPREREVYVVTPRALVRGVDPHELIEKTLGTRATVRTWNVVQTLARLAAG